MLGGSRCSQARTAPHFMKPKANVALAIEHAHGDSALIDLARHLGVADTSRFNM